MKKLIIMFTMLLGLTLNAGWFGGDSVKETTTSTVESAKDVVKGRDTKVVGDKDFKEYVKGKKDDKNTTASDADKAEDADKAVEDVNKDPET